MAKYKSHPPNVTADIELDRHRFTQGAHVSRETMDGLDLYAGLLVKWQAAINLVGPMTLGTLWTRHFLDSLQVGTLLGDAQNVVDLGSGAGFPGCIVALALKERWSNARVTLVESNGKKVSFLKIVVQTLKLPAHVYSGRIETAIGVLMRPDIVTARALAPLSDLIRWCEPWLLAGTIALFHKGRDVDKELADAARYWDIDYSVLPSVVDSGSVVLRITSIVRR